MCTVTTLARILEFSTYPTPDSKYSSLGCPHFNPREWWMRLWWLRKLISLEISHAQYVQGLTRSYFLFSWKRRIEDLLLSFLHLVLPSCCGNSRLWSSVGAAESSLHLPRRPPCASTHLPQRTTAACGWRFRCLSLFLGNGALSRVRVVSWKQG